jgi:hypothetical protein
MIEFVPFIFEKRFDQFKLLTRDVRNGLDRLSMARIVGVAERVAVDRHGAGNGVRIWPTSEKRMEAETAEAAAERAHATEGGASHVAARRTTVPTTTAAVSTSNHVSPPFDRQSRSEYNGCRVAVPG